MDMYSIEVFTKSSEELYNEVSDLIRPKIKDDLEELFEIEFSEEQKAYIRLGIQMLIENYYIRTREKSEGLKFDFKSKQRRSRQSYSPYQIFYLEKYFSTNKYPSSSQKRSLALELDTTEIRVKTWFQNRRQKFKKIIEYDCGIKNKHYPKKDLPCIKSEYYYPYESDTMYNCDENFINFN